MKKILMAGAALSLLAGSNVWAACGDIGTTADCDALIDLTIPANVTIDRLADTTLAISGSSASAAEPFCVAANDTGATVQLTVTTTQGDGTDGAFEMVGTANADTIEYSLELATGPTALAYNTATTVPAADVGTDMSCPGDTSTLNIDTVTDINTVTADTYEQTITVTVSSI